MHPSTDRVQDPSRPKYYTGHGVRRQPRSPSAKAPPRELARLVSLGSDYWNLRLNGKPVTAEWRDVFIAEGPPPSRKDVPPALYSRLHSIAPAPPFRIPVWLVLKLTALGMEPRPVRLESRPGDGKPLLASATFEDPSAREGIRLILGTCVQSLDQSRPAHWAKAIPRYAANWNQLPNYGHLCREDHIDAWMDETKDFGDGERTVRLSFSRCTSTPAYTLVVHVELRGSLYDDLKDRRDVEFPSREEVALGLSIDPPAGE